MSKEVFSKVKNKQINFGFKPCSKKMNTTIKIDRQTDRIGEYHRVENVIKL